MNLGRLKVICPAAHDTVFYGGETANPAIIFPFDGLNVFGVQYQDSLVSNKPADAWIVRGANGVLFRRVPVTAQWAVLRGAFGPGIADGGGSTIEDLVTVMFCAYPRLFLVVAASPDSLTTDRAENLSRIPSGARITQVNVFPRPNPTWSC
jgi:hypothetical protein